MCVCIAQELRLDITMALLAMEGISRSRPARSKHAYLDAECKVKSS